MTQPVRRPKKAQSTESPIKKEKPVLTKDQADQLRQIFENITDIRRTVSQLEDSDDLSLPKVMFNLGKVFKMADQTEDSLSDLLEKLEERQYTINF